MTRVLVDYFDAREFRRPNEKSRYAHASANKQETVTDQPDPEVVVGEFLPFQHLISCEQPSARHGVRNGWKAAVAEPPLRALARRA